MEIVAEIVVADFLADLGGRLCHGRHRLRLTPVPVRVEGGEVILTLPDRKSQRGDAHRASSAAVSSQGSESRLTGRFFESGLQVRGVPGCQFSAELEACWFWDASWLWPSFERGSGGSRRIVGGPEEIEGEVAHDGHVVGAMPLAQA